MRDVKIKVYTLDSEAEHTSKQLLVTSFRAPRAVRVIIETDQDEVMLAVGDNGKLDTL